MLFDKVERRLGGAQRAAAARIFFYERFMKIKGSPQNTENVIRFETVPSVEVQVTVYALYKIGRTRYCLLRELDTDDRSLGDETLDCSHRKYPIDVALKAAASLVKGQGEGVQHLPGIETHDPSGGSGRADTADYSCRVEAVVKRAGVELCGHLGPEGDSGQKFLSGAAARQFCGGEGGRNDGRAEVHARREPVLIVKRPCHDTVDERSSMGRYLVAGCHDCRFRLASPAFDQFSHPPAVLLSGPGNGRAQHAQRQVSNEMDCFAGQFLVLRLCNVRGEPLFRVHIRPPFNYWGLRRPLHERSSRSFPLSRAVLAIEGYLFSLVIPWSS